MMLQWLFKKKPTGTPPSEKAASSKASPSTGADQSNRLAQTIEIASQHHNAGRFSEAEAGYRRILAVDAENFDALHLLGVLSFQMGHRDQAVELIARAIAINPVDPIAHCNLGELYRALNQWEEASVCYQKALALKPDYVDAHYYLGNVLGLMGRLDEALTSYSTAVSLNPDLADAHNNLGNLLAGKGRLEEAILSYRKALAIKPEYAEAQCNLGNALKTRGKLDDALACIQKAVLLNPGFAAAHSSLGELLREKGQFDEAIASHQRALSIDPGFAEAHNCLGVTFQLQDKLSNAIACFRKAVSFRPDFAAAHSNLGMSLAQMGRNDEAVAALRRALSISPDFVVGHSNLLFCLSHDPHQTPEEVFAEHRAFGDRFEAPFRGRWPHHRNLPDPGRTLRVGFVSADLRTHAVSSFIEPLWAALDSKQVEIWAYSNHRLEDEVTLRLKGMAHQWRKVAVMSDEELADQIREDEIDILFDLSGHTGDNRLLTFARKPAPIQVSWIGNPNTTGLKAMDYYLADWFSAPPGLLDALFTEKIVRLPSGALFQPLDPAPAVNGLPALESGVLTFGSFNRSDKVTEGVVALWSRVLNAVPGSRMLLGGLSDASRTANLAEQFARNGVDRGRLIFHPRVGMTEYLALHHQVDLILDTFPFGGGTTSCHAAWMGVPVLTLAGKTMASRVGLIINSNIGLPEFITESEDAFVTQAVRWSQRLPELAALRASLRSQVLASPLCQTQAAARWLELALRTMWQRWCEGKPPESFGINP